MRSRWTIPVLLLCVSMFGTAFFASVPSNPGQHISRQPGQTPFFQDNFSGSAIDSSKWNTTFATSGLRWCPSTVANHEDVAGLWQDPSTVACQGVTENPPYGSVSVSGGAATLSSTFSHAAPYIWSGLPSKNSPFPSSGNFVLEVKLAYNQLAGAGDGLFVARWNNTDPVGNNPPGGHPRIFLVWGDASGLFVQLLGNFTYTVYNQFATHDYVLEYLNGRYSVFVDGNPAIGPVASDARASSIWLGNPVFNWWQQPQTWSSFSISLVQVTSPSIQLSPSAGPIGTKVLVQGSSIPVSAVEVTFDDNFIGTTQVTGGNFTFTLDVPLSQTGAHQIKAIDSFLNDIAIAPFTITPSSAQSGLAVTLTVGTIYFPGDNAVASLLVTSGGVPAGSPSLQLNLTLTRPDNSKLVLHPASLGSGLFSASYAIPGNALVGTYLLIASAHLAGSSDGSALATFEVKLPWFNGQARSAAIVGAVSVAAVGIGMVSWRMGYLKRSSKDPA